MKAKSRFRKFLKYSAYTLTFNWALALAVFFHDPDWSRAQINRCYNWVTDKKFPFVHREPCVPYRSVAWRLNDKTEQYWEHSVKNGIEGPKFIRDIRKQYKLGKLVYIEPTGLYSVDTMYYSYAFAVPKTKIFIDTLAARFQSKLVNTDLHGAKLMITSLLRTESSVARLRKRNRNAIKKSAHLHGTTFDVSYTTYDFSREVTAAEAEYLREVLAKALLELREEKKCWVTYEIYQTCFHVVAR